MTALEKARIYFAADRFAVDVLGAEIEVVEEGYARCSLALSDLHRNAEGHVMGGALFTLADFAFAVAANQEQPPTVSLSCQTSFLNPPQGDRMVAEAHCIRHGYSVCYYNVEVRDGLNNLVAVMGVNGFTKRG